MTLTRSVSTLTSVYTTVEPPFFARTSDLSAEWEFNVQEALSEHGGSIEDTMLSLGLNLTDEQKEKYCQQALKKPYATWLDECSTKSVSEHGDDVDEAETNVTEEAEPNEDGEEKDAAPSGVSGQTPSKGASLAHIHPFWNRILIPRIV